MPFRLIWGLLCLITLGQPSIAVANQGLPLLTDLKVVTHTVQNGIQGSWVEARVNVTPQLPADTIGASAKSRSYRIALTLTKAGGVPVRVPGQSQPFNGLGDRFRSSKLIPNGLNPRDNFLAQFFIPYYAVDLVHGKHDLTFEITVYNPAKKVVGEPLSGSLQMDIPRHEMYRIAVEHFATPDTAPTGQPWDLAIFSQSEKLPDLQWQISLNGLNSFQSKWKKNTLSYSGSVNQDRSNWFVLAEGDQIDLEIIDHDITTKSDRMASYAFTPFNTKSGQQTAQCPGVESLIFNLERRAPPKLAVRDFKSSVSGKEDGVSGFNIFFGYTVPNRTIGNEYWVEIQQDCGSGTLTRPHLERISGPATLASDGRYKLVSQRGELKFFLPYHALCQQGGKPAPIHFRIVGEAESKSFTLFEERLDVKHSVDHLDDLEFGQFKAGIASQAGQDGIQFTSAYQLPTGYLQDHPDAKVEMVFALHVAGKTLSVSNFPLYNDSPDNTPLPNRGGKLKGAINLFIPFTSLPRKMDQAPCDIEMECMMVEGETFTSIGQYAASLDVELPPLEEISFRVSRLKLSKNAVGKDKPNAYWVVYVGQTLLYEASPIFGLSEPTWGISTNLKTVVSPTDQISILLIHEAIKGELVELGSWKGSLEDLPAQGESRVITPAKGVEMELIREQ